MLTYELKKEPGMPLYEGLYQHLREDIRSGRLAPGEKLPSKRTLAENLKISKITVENAYNQLLSEGYIVSREKVGYFVEKIDHLPLPRTMTDPVPETEESPTLDLTANGPAHFPFSVWIRLQREVMLDYGESLLQPLDNQGCSELRRAIAKHLADFRGMSVSPEQIIIGAGTDFLYNLLIQLLGRELVYAVEEPGYGKIRKIYHAGGVQCRSAQMDDRGVIPESLADARVLHISPSHHFPTGLVTPIARRLELLHWAECADGWVIEDDYDSEFRFHARPMPAMQSLDKDGRVIYMNTFSKSLAPSIRISYMVLPEPLLTRFRQMLGFYSCTVTSFEQYTLARFLSRGLFEKHINRMRKFYKTRRNKVVAALENCPFASRITILEQNAGLHFLMRVRTELSDRELVQRFADAGVAVSSLSSYYRDSIPEAVTRCLVVNYSGLEEEQLFRLKEVRIEW